MADPSEAVDFLRLVTEAESNNRAEGLEDLKFRYGDQWPTEIQNSRQLETRPCLTINETDSYCRQVTNSMRQQRPRIKVHPVNDTADVKIAEVITGLTRHIEVNSDADNAYDLAGDFAVTMGFGYIRMRTDYIREDSFDQDIFIDQVENPFSVYFDPNSTLPDGSDSERALVTDVISKEAFELEYPDADMAQFTSRGTGDSTTEWVTKTDIRLAEMFKVEKERSKLVALSDGTISWADRLPDVSVLDAAGVSVSGERESYRRRVRWWKQTETQILDQKTLPGRWIPIIPVYGNVLVIEGKRKRFGMVRFAKDPQRMVNFWKTALTESIALAPKAKWVMAEGQDEGHENEWAQANTKSFPYLRYNPVDVRGQPAPPPNRVQPEGPQPGIIEGMQTASMDLQRTMGIFDPETGQPSGPKSGKAIRAEQGQSEMSNYHFFDNLTRSIKHVGRICLDWIPEVYDQQRVMRIIGDDQKPDLVTINEKKEQEGIQRVLNDVTVGQYDVVMDTGPGFNTRRLEGLEVFTNLLSGPLGEAVAHAGADLVVRMIDAPGADALADRLAAANPLAQIDDKSDIPPPIQMKLKQQEQMIQQLQQALKEAGIEIKFRTNIEKMKQDGETKRELMRQTSDAHEREITQAQKQHDTETFALSAQNVAEINGLVKLLTSKTEHGHKLREMLLEFEHATQLQDSQLKAKSSEMEAVH